MAFVFNKISVCIISRPGVEDEDKFFSTQERQSIVLHLLYSMRINENQLLNGIKFKLDQSLSKQSVFL